MSSLCPLPKWENKFKHFSCTSDEACLLDYNPTDTLPMWNCILSHDATKIAHCLFSCTPVCVFHAKPNIFMCCRLFWYLETFIWFLCIWLDKGTSVQYCNYLSNFTQKVSCLENEKFWVVFFSTRSIQLNVLQWHFSCCNGLLNPLFFTFKMWY